MCQPCLPPCYKSKCEFCIHRLQCKNAESGFIWTYTSDETTTSTVTFKLQ